MWFTLPGQTPLYRVSRAEDEWGDVLRGMGAHYNEGGRYNLIAQHTVYAAEDPLVVLTEFGWHQAQSRFLDLGLSKPLTYPLVEVAKLWRFCFNANIQLVDVRSPESAQRFGYPAQMPYNCDPNHRLKKDGKPIVSSSQTLANQIRSLIQPELPYLRPEGLLAPSVRIPYDEKYQPRQVVFFVVPAHGSVEQTLQERASLLGEWQIELEFLSATTQRAATSSDPLIDWLTPQYRVSAAPAGIPRYASRPGSKSIPFNKWHELDIRYSPY